MPKLLMMLILFAVLLTDCAERVTAPDAVIRPNETPPPETNRPAFSDSDLVGTWAGKNSHSGRISLIVERIADSIKVTSLSLSLYCTANSAVATVTLENSSGFAAVIPLETYYRFMHTFEGPGNSLMRIRANFRSPQEVNGLIFFEPQDTLQACQTRADSLHFKARNLFDSGN